MLLLLKEISNISTTEKKLFMSLFLKGIQLVSGTHILTCMLRIILNNK